MHDSGQGPTFLAIGELITDTGSYHGPENYKILSYLGKGGFAQCFSAQSLKYKDRVAVKVVEKAQIKNGMFFKMNREIRLQKEAEHKNIVRLHTHFESPRFFFLVMELCNAHSLLHIINHTHVHRRYMDLEVCRKYLKGVLSAVDYLLKKDILHRDIKPGNIFIGLGGEAKLGDFGLAIERKDLHSGSVSGTPNYLAPEILKQRGHSEASEVWSIGCLLYCMVTGRPPFETDSLENTYAKIQKADYRLPYARRTNPQVNLIIRMCLELNPSRRPTVSALLNDSWMVYGCTQEHQNIYAQLPAMPSNLLRTKSVGDMLKDMNSNISIRNPRPKSTAGNMHMDHLSISEKSQRKSMTGSHDSGFGSEVDMSRRPAISDRVKRILNDLKMVIDRTHHLVPCQEHAVFVSKWVDYSNRRGFACTLSDGALTLKFNEGSCINWPAFSDYLVYANSPFSAPKIINARHINPDSAEFEQCQTASYYQEYMNLELAGMANSSSPTSPSLDSPYLVFHYFTPDFLLLVLSNGTVQVNFMKQKTKVVLWKNESVSGNPCFITFISHGKLNSYRVQKSEYMPYYSDDTSAISCLSEVFRIIAGNCDFLSRKKPTLSTEC